VPLGQGCISISVINWAFWNGFAPVKILYAIPLPSFSVASNCARSLLITSSVPVSALNSGLLAKSCSIQRRQQYGEISFPYCIPQRTDGMAKSLMSLQPFPKAQYVTETGGHTLEICFLWVNGVNNLRKKRATNRWKR
jgi:hypothetical protein